MNIIGFRKILLLTEITNLQRFPFNVEVALSILLMLIGERFWFDLLLPISISTKLIGFKMAKLIGAIRYR